MTKPVAKSLHTITVLQQVAYMFIDSGDATSEADAVGKAMAILGLADRPDPYGLGAASIRLMEKAR